MKLHICTSCQVPHVPDEIADRVRNGETISVEIISPSGVAANVLAHGTGALNIGGCRIGSEVRLNPAAGNKPGGAALNMSAVGMPQGAAAREAVGRWPSNVLLGHGEGCADACAPGCPVAELDAQTGTLTSRFFPSFRYQAKAPARERPKVDGVAHPTCKPLTVMQWLIRLVCPPGGTILEPFAGSGTTVEAAILEGFDVIAVEREAEYLPLIGHRVERANAALAERAATELRRATTEPAPLFDLPA